MDVKFKVIRSFKHLLLHLDRQNGWRGRGRGGEGSVRDVSHPICKRLGGKGGTVDSGLRRRETAQDASSPIWRSDIGCVKPPRSAAAQAILFSDA